MKSYIAPIFAGFIFVFIYEFIIHGFLLNGIYEQTPNLWRAPETMGDFIPFSIAMQFLMTALLAVIFAKSYKGGGLLEGLRFGALLGALFGLSMASAYIYMPISALLAALWFATGFFQLLGLGLIFALTYKPSP